MLIGRVCKYLPLRVGEGDRNESIDRRIAHRSAVFFRAKIFPIDVFCDARIRDVSATGLEGDVVVELAIGQTVHVTADEHSYHAGVVKWIRDREFRLDLPDADRIFRGESTDRQHGDRGGHPPRAPKSKLNAAARIVAGRPPRPAMVRNLSASGMLLDTIPGIKLGQHLVITIGHGPPIYGRAQWSEQGKLGFKAWSPISVLGSVCAVE